MAKDKRDDTRLEQAVHRTLLGGIALSGVFLLLGLLVVLVQGQPRPEGIPSGLVQLIRTAAVGNGTSLINLGVLLLMVTPLARVAVLAVGWMLAGDRRFAVVALTVLGLLGLSLILGIG